MEDNEVLLENDPLAVYIKNLNIPYDVELTVNEIQLENERKNSKHDYKADLKRFFKYNDFEFQFYRQEILKSELLFNDDCSVLQAYYTEGAQKRNSYVELASYASLTVLGASIFFLPIAPLKKLVGTVCFVPSLWKGHSVYRKNKKMREIARLLVWLRDFTVLTKKCLRLLIEYSMTLNYYSSSPQESSLYTMLMHFAQLMYSFILETTNLLRYKSFDLLFCVPLTVELPYLEKINVVQDVKINDVKIQYEYFLLTQSHFLKILGLTFCPNLWKTEDNDFKTIFSNILPMLSTILLDKLNSIHFEYNAMKNFGVVDKTIRPPRKFANLAISNIYTCLQTAELHYHQLLCKLQDAQRILSTRDFATDVKPVAEALMVVLSDIDGQSENPKHYVNAAMIGLNRLLQNDPLHQSLFNLNNTAPGEPCSVPPPPAMPMWEPEPPRGNEVYELFIPKEGLAPITEEIPEDVFNCKDYEYSGTLLEELKMLLKERNPEIIEEESKITEVIDDEEDRPKLPVLDLFRPQQPVGFTDSMLSNILAARQQMQREEEFFCENEEVFN